MRWPSGPMAAFDLETTGIDIESDRIVTAALVFLEPDGRVSDERTWMLDPGVVIPEEAAAIHGISTEQARKHGVPAGPAVAEISTAVAQLLRVGTPLVIMNARYDLSLLDRECRRHQVAPLSARQGARLHPVIDPLVLDKHADRYRKGRRTLQALCAHYGVPLDSAHDARSDAVAAARVARRIGEEHPSIGTVGLAELSEVQVRAAAAQSASLQRFLRRTSDPSARIASAWPLIPAQRSAEGPAKERSESIAPPS
ncbi:exonuclease domain-containing protein [Streptomyces violaceusniger]|uniref:Exonuclease RNase T and DNA polymerase III n=1 Tax=Streptomyces violaceusniger (strain Tu 4113) TaxID=653045 RepID=G2PGX3_STRV4|nr:exonuclease domain-containing protein [Streptomyces violaceusniger]AEM88687.1 Exonuclease RNase T and DNA polymerase III [Streptomyces violaceusniger Tu 4113]